MIPLLFILLAAGAGLAAYELSPRAHAWVDTHVHAIQDAFAAHRAAEAHMQTAGTAAVTGDPASVALSLAEADAANKLAAQRTADAAASARTAEQRQLAAHSAGQVIDRDQRIAAAMAHLGVGQCGVKTYAGVTTHVKDALLLRLHAAGMTVTGDNPWDIDTKIAGVRLRAVWDPHAQALRLVVVTGADLPWLFCDAIWGRIDPIMHEVAAA